MLLTQQLVVLIDAGGRAADRADHGQGDRARGQDASPLTTARNRALAGTLVLGVLAVCAAGLAARAWRIDASGFDVHRAEPNGIAPRGGSTVDDAARQRQGPGLTGGREGEPLGHRRGALTPQSMVDADADAVTAPPPIKTRWVTQGQRVARRDVA